MRTQHLFLLVTSALGVATACSAGGTTVLSGSGTSTGTGTPGSGTSGSGTATTTSSGGLGGGFASTGPAGSTGAGAAGNGGSGSASTSTGSLSSTSSGHGSATSSGSGTSTGNGSGSSTSSAGSSGGGSSSSGGGSSTTTSTTGSTSTSSGGATFGSSCSGDTILTGTVYAPNGTDPIPNVRVYVPVTTPLPPYPAGYCDKCNTPLGSVYASTFTSATGTFSLNLNEVPAGSSVPFAIQIGRFRKWTSIDVTCGQTQSVPQGSAPQPNWLPGASGTNADIPNIVVSTGNTDHLDAVLTNLGITQFDCFEGRVAETGQTLSTYACGSTMITSTSPTIASVLSTSTTLDNYNMAFLSCAPNAYATFVTPKGSTYTEPGAKTTYPGLGYNQQTITNNTASWVGQGGRLFVTDTAYDYVAQAFPEQITWQGAGGDPQPIDGANVGCAPAPSSGSAHAVPYATTVNDNTLAQWLTAVGFTSSPNVDVIGFYEPWSAMSSLNLDAGVTNIASSTVMPLDPTYVTTQCKTPTISSVPLTADFDVPTCGRVIFSSYHTYTGTGSTGDAGLNTAANEKIMEYLIFAAATCSR